MYMYFQFPACQSQKSMPFDPKYKMLWRLQAKEQSLNSYGLPVDGGREMSVQCCGSNKETQTSSDATSWIIKSNLFH